MWRTVTAPRGRIPKTQLRKDRMRRDLGTKLGGAGHRVSQGGPRWAPVPVGESREGRAGMAVPLGRRERRADPAAVLQNPHGDFLGWVRGATRERCCPSERLLTKRHAKQDSHHVDSSMARDAVGQDTARGIEQDEAAVTRSVWERGYGSNGVDMRDT